MNNKLQRIFALFLSLLVLLTIGNFSAFAEESDDLEDFFSSLLGDEETEVEEEVVIVPNSDEEALNAAISKNTVIALENNAVRLQVDKSTGNLYVTDKASSKLWTSNPFDAQKDTLASGVTRTNLLSQIIVTYIEDKNLSSVNNYVASTGRDGAEYSVDGDVIRATYTFVNEEFVVPVEYSITENGFKVDIIFKDIKDTAKRRVHKIELLPYFGAAGQTDEGYMLIPDGCGALVELNSKKVDNFPYEKAFYGGDKGITPNVSTTKDKSLLLPVYGIKNGNSAFVATILSGAENASLYACVAGKQSNYNRIYTEAVYRVYDTVDLKDSVGKSVYAKYTAINATELDKYSVSYTLLNGDKASYVGMADAVREQLKNLGMEKTEEDNINLFLDFYGATLKERAFLGLRYTGVQKLTTFEQAKSILKKLSKQGVDSVKAGYRNFSSSEYNYKLASKVAPASKLGGKKGYKSLLSYAEKNNVEIYPYADFVTFAKNGNSYWSFSDVVLGLELSMTKRFEYTINEGIPDESKSPWYLVAGNRFGDAKKQLLKSLNKYDSTGVLFDRSASYVYNDFSPKGHQATKTVAEMQKIYKAIKKQGQKLMLSAPNAYSLIHADTVTDLPMTSSQYLIFDKDIPFIQMVLKGYIPYSSEALNIDGVSDITILQMIETASQPKFAVIYEEGKELLRTDLDYLYGATFSSCEDTLVSYYKTLSSVWDKIGDASMIYHAENNELVSVKYSNGITIHINYAKTEQTAADGTTIPSLGYKIVG